MQTVQRNQGKKDCVSVVQKPPSEVAATAYEEGTLIWAPTSGAETLEVGAPPKYGTPCPHLKIDIHTS